jgi:hypothetical protein
MAEPGDGFALLRALDALLLEHRDCGQLSASPSPVLVERAWCDQRTTPRQILIRSRATTATTPTIPLKQRHEVCVHCALVAVVERLNRRLRPPLLHRFVSRHGQFLIAFSASADSRINVSVDARHFFCAAFRSDIPRDFLTSRVPMMERRR